MTSYTAIMRQGESTQTITTASLSSVFNVSSGEGPLYFTVTAANVADSGGVAELESNGSPYGNETYMYGFVLPLNGKTLESITHPSNSKVRIFDVQPFQQ